MAMSFPVSRCAPWRAEGCPKPLIRSRFNNGFKRVRNAEADAQRCVLLRRHRGAKEVSCPPSCTSGFTSDLESDEFDRRPLERRPHFREVPGLLQKIYGPDRATGDVCGIYFFESEDALEAFRETELARTIPAAYEAVDVRREIYDVLYSLWPERGPFVRASSEA
jgi:hypothetical protein